MDMLTLLKLSLISNLLTHHIGTVYSCNGIWSVVNSWSIIANLSAEFNKCEYSGSSVGAMPVDIREDTHFLSLRGNSLTNADLNMAVLDSQIITLWALELKSNLLTEVPDVSVFTSLTFLDLSHNNIVNLDLNQLTESHIPQLRTFNIAGNSISEDTITPITGNNTSTLEILTVNGNDITIFDFNLFLKMPMLDTLYISWVHLTEIVYPDANNNVPIERLTMIGLYDDVNLARWFENVTEHLPELQKLNLNKTSFTEPATLDLNIFLNLEYLENLAFAESNIRGLVPVVDGQTLPRLEVLFLQDIPLSGCFDLNWVEGSGLPVLKVLYLSDNTDLSYCPIIPGVTPSAVKAIYMDQTNQNGCYNLKTVDQSQFSALELVSLNYNNINGLCVDNEDTVLTDMQEILLNGNWFTEADLIFFSKVTPNLRHLSLANNLISRVIPLKSGQYLSQLGELNLNNNRIKTLSPYCEPYFSVLESGAFKLRLRNMSLECNSCFLWVKLCPYNIIFADGDSPTCSGPELLGGEYLVNITAEELAVTPCKESSVWFGSDRQITPLQDIPPAAIIYYTDASDRPGSSRTRLECASQCAMSGGASFTYDTADKSCTIYIDRSGEFDMG